MGNLRFQINLKKEIIILNRIKIKNGIIKMGISNEQVINNGVNKKINE